MKKIIYLSLFSILSLINSFSLSIDWLDDKISATDPKTGDKYVLGKVKKHNLIYVEKQKPDTKKYDEDFDKNFKLSNPNFPYLSKLDFKKAKITIEDSKIIITIDNIDPSGNIVMYTIKLNPDGTRDESFGDKNNPGMSIILKPAAPPED